jgi:hypothetical protein
VQVIGGVEADDAGDERPGAEETTSEGRQLVGGLGIRGVCGRDELIGGVFGVVGRRGGRQLRVADEAAVVDATREMEGCVGLDAVADRDGRELSRG